MSRLQPRVLTVRELFDADEYVIPIYQRAYAWSRDEILTLLSDVSDYRERGAANYYIGSLVTHARAAPMSDEIVYEVVDGQQRLTTLFIALAILGESTYGLRNVLRYEGRQISTSDLGLLAKYGRDCSVDDLRVFGIKVCVETVRAARNNGDFTDEDFRYLLDNVRIVLTTLPAKTDLNHYFEVMNSRGEQLEKHEVVKASLLASLTDSDADGRVSRTLALVWDACSDMSRHVVSNFGPRRRTELFGDQWDGFLPQSFVDVIEALDLHDAERDTQSKELGTLLSKHETLEARQSEGAKTDELDRYGAITDFPNFLLHVLALSRGRVALDDKQLVIEFERLITTPEHVRAFTFDLLRTRWLFDRYVIKTDLSRGSDDDSNWVLQRVRKRERSLAVISTFALAHDDDATSRDQEHIVVLQSMFQVTDSRRSYKTFLYDILEFLDARHAPVPSGEFVEFLQSLASKRYLNTQRISNLHGGTSVPHLAFNYLDYLLWRCFSGDDFNVGVSSKSVAHQGYRFRYRSSVEHFYPQNPDPSGNIEALQSSDVDHFGNLCLMSRSENSQRSNLAPGAKIEQYRSEQQSLKFQVMASIRKVSGNWDVTEIRRHGTAMVALLENGSSFHENRALTERGSR